MGFFVGPKPSPKVIIRAELSKAWRLSFDVHELERGFFLFKFNSLDDSQRVLELGPWFVFGQPLVLKRGSRKVNLQREETKAVRLWIKFPNLNLACKAVNVLSKLASCIGAPICMDKLLASGTKPDHACVLVEVSADSPLPDSFKYLCKGHPMEQNVEYVYKPNACTH